MMAFNWGDVLWAGTTLLAYLAWREARLSRKERASAVDLLAQHISSIGTAHAASIHQAIRDEATAQCRNQTAHVDVVARGHAADMHKLLNEQLSAVQNTLEERLPAVRWSANDGRSGAREATSEDHRWIAAETKG